MIPDLFILEAIQLYLPWYHRSGLGLSHEIRSNGRSGYRVAMEVPRRRIHEEAVGTRPLRFEKIIWHRCYEV